MSSAVRQLNQNASVIDSKYALHMNISAAKGLCDVLKTNLGPKGTIKMLVNGAGDVRLTKDGCELLNNMSIQNPTASMIARSATAQDDVTGDGTTTICLTIGEILKHAERSITEGVHPRVIADGLEAAKHEALKFLSGFKIVKEKPDRETLLQVARSSLCTKLTADLADNLAEIVVRSVQTIEKEDGSIDLFMVEILHMLHRFDMETRFVEGIVLDHGYRHSEMPKVQKDVHILTMNCSLEYEKSEVNSSFMYKNAYDREKLVAAERKHTDDRVKKIVDFKHKVCGDSGKGFLIVNHKGIDPLSLDMLNSAGIVAVRRAKRRNLERVTLACGGQAVNSLDALSEELLGHADSVVEETLGEEKYVFIEGVANPRSCSILVKGPNAHTIAQIKAAVRDGIRAVRNTMVDKCVVPGAGAFEVSCANHLLTKFMPTVSGRARLGVEAFAKGLLVVPKALCENAGHDAQDSIIKMTEEVEQGNVVGVDLATGEPVDAIALGVLDNVRVKAQCINSSAVIATQLVLVDSILKAGRPMKKDKQ